MPQFNYEGINKYGDRVRGLLLADNELDLRIKLRRQSIRPTKITEERVFDVKAKKLTEQELIIFIKELVLMLSNSLTVVQALDVLESTAYTKSIRILSARVKAFIRHGNTFSQAVSQFPEIFDELLLNVIAVGELKGKLPEMLGEWVKFKEEEQSLDSVVNSSILLPFIMLFVFLLLFAIAVLGLEPLIVKYFAEKLPELTLKAFKIVRYGAFVVFIFLSVLGAVLTSAYLIYGKNRFIYTLRRIFIKIPIFSFMLKKYLSAKAILILKFTIAQAFPLKRAIHLVLSRISEPLFEDVFLQLKEASAKREPIAPILAKSYLFPMVVVQLIGVAETMGSLEMALNDSYQYIRTELTEETSVITNFLEPLILILGGVLVGILATMLFAPLVLR